MHDLDSFLGALKNIRLSDAERYDIKNALVAAVTNPAPLALDVVEKGDLFSRLADRIVSRQPVLAPVQMNLLVWHGTLFSHLKPFVLR